MIPKIGFIEWLRYQKESVTTRLVIIHLLAILGLIGLTITGFLGPVLIHGGAFAWLILGVAIANACGGVLAAYQFEKSSNLPRTIARARNTITWMEYLDGAVLVLGFIGMLYGSILELTSIDPSVTGTAMVGMLKNVLRGVGIAIYAILAGAGAGLWTSTATRLFSNAVESEVDKVKLSKS